MDWFLYDNDPHHERVKDALGYFENNPSIVNIKEMVLI